MHTPPVRIRLRNAATRMEATLPTSNNGIVLAPRSGIMASPIESRPAPGSFLSALISNRIGRSAGPVLLAAALVAGLAYDASPPRSQPNATLPATPSPPATASRTHEIATASPGIAARESVSVEDRIFSQLKQHRKRTAVPELRFLAKTIVEEAQSHGMDPGLILAIIQVESGCRRHAISPVGARGLMQVMPSTGAAVAKKLSLEWKGEDSLFDPRVNIKLGVAYLAELKQRYGDIRKALVAYNWGPTRIDRMLRLGKALPRTYVEVVLSTYESGRDPGVRRS